MLSILQSIFTVCQDISSCYSIIIIYGLGWRAWIKLPITYCRIPKSWVLFTLTLFNLKSPLSPLYLKILNLKEATSQLAKLNSVAALTGSKSMQFNKPLFHHHEQIFCPDTSSEPIVSVISQSYSFLGSSKCEDCQHRAKYLFSTEEKLNLFLHVQNASHSKLHSNCFSLCCTSSITILDTGCTLVMRVGG